MTHPSNPGDHLDEATAELVDRVNRRTVAYADAWPRLRRTARSVCPHCSETVDELAGHVRDTGAAAIRPPGSCPVLFAKRNRGTQ